MNTPCIAPCVAIPLYRPWWQRLFDRAPAPRHTTVTLDDQAGWRRRDWQLLAGLSERTLRDIGAPEWLHAERDARTRLGLDLMRL